MKVKVLLLIATVASLFAQVPMFCPPCAEREFGASGWQQIP
jgi:hypothetical protein